MRVKRSEARAREKEKKSEMKEDENSYVWRWRRHWREWKKSEMMMRKKTTEEKEMICSLCNAYEWIFEHVDFLLLLCIANWSTQKCGADRDGSAICVLPTANTIGWLFVSLSHFVYDEVTSFCI